MEVITMQHEVYKDLKSSLEEIKRKVSQLEAEPTEKWLDIPTVCRQLKISTRTCLFYRSSGLLPYSQYAHKIWFKASDIEAFLESNYKESFRKNKG